MLGVSKNRWRGFVPKLSLFVHKIRRLYVVFLSHTRPYNCTYLFLLGVARAQPSLSLHFMYSSPVYGVYAVRCEKLLPRQFACASAQTVVAVAHNTRAFAEETRSVRRVSKLLLRSLDIYSTKRTFDCVRIHSRPARPLTTHVMRSIRIVCRYRSIPFFFSSFFVRSLSSFASLVPINSRKTGLTIAI